MNHQLNAALPRALGHDSTHVVSVKQGTRLRHNGTRPGFVYMNAISTLHDRDPARALKITIYGHDMDDADEAVLAAALTGGKDVSLLFNRGFVDALDFLNEAFDAVEGVA
jgi:hypothetical protein